MNKEEVNVEEEVKKVIISVTADSAKAEGSVRRNSTGKASTRSSPSTLSSNEKILPHYLRASTKSCHDFCKYGKSHVFEAKKRLPIRRSFPQSSSIRDEEHKASEVSGSRERRNSSELKVNVTSRTEDGLSDEVEGIKKLGLKENESFEASKGMQLPTPLLSSKGEDSYKGLECSETMTPVPIHEIEELSEASEMAMLGSSSPTEKRIISEVPTTPLAWSEGSSYGSEDMELDSTSAIHAPNNQLEKFSEEPLGLEISTPAEIESMAFADEVTGSKPTTPSSISRSFNAGSARSRPSSSEERFSEETFVKLKIPSPNHKISIAMGKLITSKNLKVVEGKKRELTKPEVSDRTKAISMKRIESTMQSRIIKKSPSPSPAEKPKIVEQKNASTMKKVVRSVSPKIIKNEVQSSTNSFGTPLKPSISLKQKVPVVRSTPTLKSSRKLTASRDLGNKILRSAELVKPRASLSTKLPVSSEKVKNQVKVGTPEHSNEKGKEKTLHVIEPRTLKADPKPTNKEAKKIKSTSSSHTRTTSSSSLSSSSSSSRSTPSESKRSKTFHSPKCNEKRKPIRTAAIHSETKLPAPHKLKSQRGKKVSSDTENNSPRKLKPRQVKGMSETQNNKEAVRRNFIRKRRVSIGSRAELTPPGLKAPDVVLKHQDVQEKKEIQGLLNHVIEETASKLAETRKSKVKALVGAFETVISLQESRVSTSTS